MDLNELIEALDETTALCSVHWVNNETGTIQSVDEIAAACRERGVPLHIDAAQAVGKLPVNVEELECDFLSFSAHKFHGPQGIGGLYIKNGVKLPPLMLGGTQEHGHRAGTENLPGIAGLGKAAEIRGSGLSETIAKLTALRDRFESAILASIPDCQINGDLANRVCNTTNLRFDGLDGQALVARLDQADVRCSQSSACTNQQPEPSYVLRAMGLSESEAYSACGLAFPASTQRKKSTERLL